MAVSHLDRLSATDASFLTEEKEAAHMHIGGVCIFEGPPPSYDEFAEHVEARLHLVPRYRQKLAFPPLGAGKPVWCDDPRLNLEYHVRHSSLPAPGDDEQLALLIGRIFSQRLDRSKPLWEMWLVQGLEGNRFALITQDAPCARRRHLRGRPRDRALRREPGAGRPHAADPPVGAAPRAERRAAARPRLCRTWRRCRCASASASCAPHGIRARRCRTPPRSRRGSARSPGSS